MRAAVTEDDADAPGIATTRVRTDLINRHPGDPESMERTVEIGPIAHQDPDIPGTRWTTMKADPIDYLGPGDPETQTMAAGIDQGRQGGQVHHPIHLLQPPLRHGRQDWDKGWQRSRVADGRTR